MRAHVCVRVWRGSRVGGSHRGRSCPQAHRAVSGDICVCHEREVWARGTWGPGMLRSPHSARDAPPENDLACAQHTGLGHFAAMDASRRCCPPCPQGPRPPVCGFTSRCRAPAPVAAPPLEGLQTGRRSTLLRGRPRKCRANRPAQEAAPGSETNGKCFFLIVTSSSGEPAGNPLPGHLSEASLCSISPNETWLAATIHGLRPLRAWQ